MPRGEESTGLAPRPRHTCPGITRQCQVHGLSCLFAEAASWEPELREQPSWTPQPAEEARHARLACGCQGPLLQAVRAWKASWTIVCSGQRRARARNMRQLSLQKRIHEACLDHCKGRALQLLCLVWQQGLQALYTRRGGVVDVGVRHRRPASLQSPHISFAS